MKKVLRCDTCIYGKRVPGSSHHMMCTRGSTPSVYAVNRNAVKKGYFLFPFNFDAIWAEHCDGWQDKKIEEMSDSELTFRFKAVEIQRKNDMVFPMEDFLREMADKSKDLEPIVLDSKLRETIQKFLKNLYGNS